MNLHSLHSKLRTRSVVAIIAATFLFFASFADGLVFSANAQALSEARRIAIARRLQQSTVSVIVGQSSGSGFVVGDERWIITNAHVVEGAQPGTPVDLRFGAGTTLRARILQIDRSHDLALLEAETRVPSPALDLTDSDIVEVGQTVLAYGSPFGLDGTLTEGIVSARRDVQGIAGTARRLIQTDAPINPGNSGGPLVDRRGRVVGVNTAILSRTGGSHGIGFAVPSNYVRDFMERLRSQRNGTATVASANVRFGADVEEFNSNGLTGLRILRVEPNSPAQRSGLLGSEQPAPAFVHRMAIPWLGHVILSVDGRNVRTRAEFDGVLASHQPGDRIRVSAAVGPGFNGDTEVTLDAAPAAPAQPTPAAGNSRNRPSRTTRPRGGASENP